MADTLPTLEKDFARAWEAEKQKGAAHNTEQLRKASQIKPSISSLGGYLTKSTNGNVHTYFFPTATSTSVTPIRIVPSHPKVRFPWGEHVNAIGLALFIFLMLMVGVGLILDFFLFAVFHTHLTWIESIKSAATSICFIWAWTEYRSWSAKRWYKKFLSAVQQELNDAARPRCYFKLETRPSALEFFATRGRIRSRYDLSG